MKEIPFTIASFDNFLKEKKLMASKCRECSALWLPPRPICLTCKGHEMEWVEGPRISAQILGVDVAHPENIKIGTPLTADFVERGSWHFVEELAKMRKMYLAFKI